jgi:hypothetical protein
MPMPKSGLSLASFESKPQIYPIRLFLDMETELKLFKTPFLYRMIRLLNSKGDLSYLRWARF